MDFDSSAKRSNTYILSGTDTDCDVCIATPDGTISLHSVVLVMFSPWFAASMSKVWWKDQGPDLRYRYNYYLDVDNDGITTLIPQSAGKPLLKPSGTDMELNFHDLYIQLFNAFYRNPLVIADHRSLSGLIELADQYDCLPTVSSAIRSSLFERPTLDHEIRDAPTRFLEIGHQLCSARIFREAFIHCVGLRTPPHEAPTPHIASMITKESNRLEQLVAVAMRRFLGLAGFGEYTLHVRDLVRGELGRCFDQCPEAGKEGRLFRLIVENPFTGEERAEDRDLGELQYQARGLVAKVKKVARDLAVNNLKLKQEMDYLTCAELKEEDLPWI